MLGLLRSSAHESDTLPLPAAQLDSYRLPPPMIPDNYESQSDKCFIGIHYTQTVKSHDQWEWINESKTERPKWGYVTKTVGAVLRMLVDTRASANNKEPGKVRAARTGCCKEQGLIQQGSGLV